MRTRYTFLLACLLLSSASFAQIFKPVKWTTSVKKTADNEYDLTATATIESGWHVYSQREAKMGPIPTKFTYEPDGIELVGAVSEEAGHDEYDPVFEMQIKYFTDKASFVQHIKTVSDALTRVKATVEFMVCDNTRCLPPDEVDLEFILPTTGSRDTAKTSLAATDTQAAPKDSAKAEPSYHSSLIQKGLWSIFLIAFLSGFAALLTPCVFPMIPLTVSFFIKQSKTKSQGIRRASLYSFFIIVVYVLLGSLVTAIFGADSLNAVSTNVWFNLIFFLLVVVFAISFLGAFEILLPSSWINKIDAQSARGGIIGIFCMALVLALVSFSCTGPIVGTLLVEAASRGGLAPIVGMLGFSLAIALPFGLFAAFPAWLTSLPKSGGWLNTVKVVLGFLELALAFKFLSNVDLVLQLHLLEREAFLAIWIAIFGTLSLYLFGRIKLPHDASSSQISVGRLCLGLASLSFTIYLMPGMWGAPLKWINAFPPPLIYSESPQGVGYQGGSSMASAEDMRIMLSGQALDNHQMSVIIDKADIRDRHPGPYNIPAFNDYDYGLAYARNVWKPILLDFTGFACVNCRKVENSVWSDPDVLSILKNDVVLVSLYVDDKRELPEDKKVISKITGKKLKYIGQKWSEFQITRYNINAQPFYVLLDLDEKMLNEPRAYDESVQGYLDWLQDGISKFNSKYGRK